MEHQNRRKIILENIWNLHFLKMRRNWKSKIRQYLKLFKMADLQSNG